MLLLLRTFGPYRKVTWSNRVTEIVRQICPMPLMLRTFLSSAVMAPRGRESYRGQRRAARRRDTAHEWFPPSLAQRYHCELGIIQNGGSACEKRESNAR